MSFRRPRLLLAVCALLLATHPASSQPKHQLPSIGGMLMLPDHKTLVVSVPSAGQLVYFDTLTEKELKRVQLEFQPGVMALQGKKLFVATNGAATLNVLDAESGKELQEISLKGEPIDNVSCHRTKGLVYVTNTRLEVFSIDPIKGKATMTKAKGQHINVDPSNEKTVYTSIYSSPKNIALISETPGKLKIEFIKGMARCVLVKYAAEGADLKLLVTNNNGGSGHPSFSISRDGKGIAMSGPHRLPEKGLTSHNAVFDTGDMKTVKGKLDGEIFPMMICFHPHLDIVAVTRGPIRGQIDVYNSKSFIKSESFKLPESTSFPNLLTFGGNGAKLIAAQGVFNPSDIRSKQVALAFHSLKLTEKQQETLKKSLGE